MNHLIRVCLSVVMSLSALVTSHSAVCFTVDKAASPSVLTGLWWNSNESGWGATITQQYGVIFVAMYTYDAAGNPIWYVITNCPVEGAGCTGDIYKVNGGSSPTAVWKPNLALTKVGTGTLAFFDVNTGTLNFTIDGINGSKSIIRQIFASPPIAASTSKEKTLLLAKTWSLYTANRQTLFATYSIASTPIREGVNGWFLKGSNLKPYSGFPSFLDGTAVQAGFNTTTSKYYIIDGSAENGFMWEFLFDSVSTEISGCRYRYPSSSSIKGDCVTFYGN